MAGLIPQSFIDDLLAKTNIVDIIDKRVQLKRSGSNLKACCPFHKEKSPSFTVNEPKQFYYCFGCGAAGNAIGFLMEYENLSFPEAVDAIAHNLGMEVPRDTNNGAPQKPTIKRDNPLYKTLSDAQLYFAHCLRKHPKATSAINYLKDRGLSGAIARDFGIGFAPPGHQNLQQHLGQSETKNLIESGMLVENNDRVYDRFRNRITFPIRNSRGQTIGFGGRIIDPNDVPKYLNSPETPLFNKGKELYGLFEAKRSNRRLSKLVIVEGYMDVIALAQHGIPYAVATLGTAIGENHIILLFKYCKEICFCFDGDAAGRKAAAKALQVTLPYVDEKKTIKFMFLPEGHDPDSLVREIGQAHFEQQLNDAQPISEYLFAHAANHGPLNTVDQRAKFAANAKALINNMPDGDYKSLMMSELAQRSGLNIETIKATKTADKPAPAQHYRDQETPYPHNINDYPEAASLNDKVSTPIETPAKSFTANSPLVKLCLLAFHQPELANKIDTSLLQEQPDLQELLNDIQQRLAQTPKLSTPALMGHWMRNEHHKATIKQLLSFEKLWPASGANEELKQIQQYLKNKQSKHSAQQALNELTAIPFSEMSADQKQKLRQLLQKLH